MRQFELLEKPAFDASADVEELEQRKKEGRGRRQAPLDDQLIDRIARAGLGVLRENLADLQSDDPQLYGRAMRALQALMGNQGVNSLHKAVVATRSGREKGNGQSNQHTQNPAGNASSKPLTIQDKLAKELQAKLGIADPVHIQTDESARDPLRVPGIQHRPCPTDRT